MRDKLVRLNQILGPNMAQIMVVAILLSYWFPIPPMRWEDEIIMAAFVIMSFDASINTALSDFLRRLKKPWLSAYLLILVHVICPCVAFVLGHLFFPGDAAVRTGLMISGSVPMATTSLMWTNSSGGAVSLAILTVSLDALLSPVIIPLCLFITMGQTVHLDYAGIIARMLVMTTIPCLLGMSFKNAVGQQKCEAAKSYLDVLAKLMMVVIVYMNTSLALRGFVFSLSTIKLMFVLLLYASSNYMVGYAGISMLRGRTFQERIASVFCCGLRNNGVAMIIAVTYFEPATAIPIVLTVAVQQPLAGLVNNFFTRRTKGTVSS